MPTPKLSDEACIEALNLVEEYGSIFLAAKAGVTNLPTSTLEDRARKGQVRGLRPTFRKDAPRVYERKRIGRMHCVIPDTQQKEGVRSDHLEWVGNYIVDKKPDVIVHIGDHWDMPSLSSYDKGKMSFEGRRYTKDVESGRKAMERLVKPIQDYNRTAREKYEPEMHFCMGNHEIRIERFVDLNPELCDKVGISDLGIADFGWKVHPFLKVVEVDGIEYAHYFASGAYGKPVSSAAALLRLRQKSATMGHTQKVDIAMHPGTHNIGLFAGCCYLHDEAYLGPQGNEVRRQIIIKHEVEDGTYDPMMVSLRYLEKAYS